MKKAKSIFCILFFFLNISAIFADGHAKITISDLWISEAPASASVLVAYVKLKNNTSSPISLTNITSTSFSSIEIHRTVIKNDVATMERFSKLEIPSDSTLKLLPGDYHLMLFNPNKPLSLGDKTELIFYFSNESKILMEAEVKKRNINKSQHNH